MDVPEPAFTGNRLKSFPSANLVKIRHFHNHSSNFTPRFIVTNKKLLLNLHKMPLLFVLSTLTHVSTTLSRFDGLSCFDYT